MRSVRFVYVYIISEHGDYNIIISDIILYFTHTHTIIIITRIVVSSGAAYYNIKICNERNLFRKKLTNRDINNTHTHAFADARTGVAGQNVLTGGILMRV